MQIDTYSQEELGEFFRFLDGVRETSTINMLAAAPVLQEEFNMPLDDARGILRAWRETYNEGFSPEERAAECIAMMRAE